MRNSMSAALLLLAVPAFALNNRSAVSSTGLDSNPCTIASPCRSFGAAIAQTNPGGEIVALDSAGYGPFTIDASLTISGAPGVHAAITATVGTAITVAVAPSDRVTIRNLVLIGNGALDGISSTSVQPTDIRVLNCFIRGFSDAGIVIASGRLAVDNTTIVDQYGGGLANAFGIWGNSDGTNTVDIEVLNSLLDVNRIGLYCNGRTAAVVTSSTISRSPYAAVFNSETGSGVPVRGTFENCAIVFNGAAFNLDALGDNNSSIVYLSQNVIAHNNYVAALGPGSTVFTFNNNRLIENTTFGGPLTPIAFQ